MRTLKKYFLWFTIGVGAMAVVQEMSHPPQQRKWHGTVLGVPYDFRPPNLQRFMKAWWNPDDSRIFTPRDFGVGWAINIPAAMRRWQQETSQGSDSWSEGDLKE